MYHLGIKFKIALKTIHWLPSYYKDVVWRENEEKQQTFKHFLVISTRNPRLIINMGFEPVQCDVHFTKLKCKRNLCMSLKKKKKRDFHDVHQCMKEDPLHTLVHNHWINTLRQDPL